MSAASDRLSSAVFAHGGIVCVVVILKERVRLVFWVGSMLPDPEGRFNAQLEGKSRAIDFRRGDELHEDSLLSLIRAGVELNLAKRTAPRREDR